MGDKRKNNDNNLNGVRGKKIGNCERVEWVSWTNSGMVSSKKSQL